ncbi:MAG: hypothetical protein HUJ56_01870 [Erysipelotrichaceae bacterium]|nr:hypothetical protein [Erysipelotrichaceae bacterium]
MTVEQEREVMKAVDCMNKARIHLDNAMYYSSELMQPEDFKKVRNIYDQLCKVLDLC